MTGGRTPPCADGVRQPRADAPKEQTATRPAGTACEWVNAVRTPGYAAGEAAGAAAAGLASGTAAGLATGDATAAGVEAVVSGFVGSVCGAEDL